MVLPDVNVLVCAHREDTREHAGLKAWLESVLSSDGAYAYSELVLSGFVRVVTHPRVFRTPSRLDLALQFASAIRGRVNAVSVVPGARHWEIFSRLATEAGAKGNLIPDAYLAALAIESGCELVSSDRDFSRFEGLRWSLPGDVQ